MGSVAAELISGHITMSVTYDLCDTRTTVTFPAAGHQTNLHLYAEGDKHFTCAQEVYGRCHILLCECCSTAAWMYSSSNSIFNLSESAGHLSKGLKRITCI